MVDVTSSATLAPMPTVAVDTPSGMALQDSPAWPTWSGALPTKSSTFICRDRDFSGAGMPLTQKSGFQVCPQIFGPDRIGLFFLKVAAGRYDQRKNATAEPA